MAEEGIVTELRFYHKESGNESKHIFTLDELMGLPKLSKHDHIKHSDLVSLIESDFGEGLKMEDCYDNDQINHYEDFKHNNTKDHFWVFNIMVSVDTLYNEMAQEKVVTPKQIVKLINL